MGRTENKGEEEEKKIKVGGKKSKGGRLVLVTVVG